MISRETCTGCSACKYHCPVGAISIIQDEDGFYCAHVDETLCIHCNLCDKICPQKNPIHTGEILGTGTCYAMVANEPYLTLCSSGGIFGLIGSEFIKSNGYVAGAYWNENFKLQHGVAQDEEDLMLLLGSKYVQSDMTDTFQIIQQQLTSGSEVLFCGTPCQVAGLRSFLQKDYNNLFTVDFICHGTPSPGVLSKYIDYLEKEHGNVNELYFRYKPMLGWYAGFYAEFANGAKIKESSDDNLYMSAFLNNWTLNNQCFNCKYKSKRCSDITLGDFWGIERVYPDSGNGVSFVLPHTQKGINLIRLILPKLKQTLSLPVQFAINNNPSLVSSVTKNIARDIFLDRLRHNSFVDAYAKTISALHYDYGMILWWSNNYGNAMTNYALYQTLVIMGYSVLAIDNFFTTKTDTFQDFATQNYNLSSQIISQHNFTLLNMLCDNFIVGSDQTWNYRLTNYVYNGHYFGLGFADDNKKKIAYAPSFASPDNIPSGEEASRYAQIYKRFDAISVREKFAVKGCRDAFGLDAEWVVDPVFLLDKNKYMELSQNSTLHDENKFITVYILDPTLEKLALIEAVEASLNIKNTYWIVDTDGWEDDSKLKLVGDRKCIVGTKIENWLYLMANAEYIVTDSFHGTCFSIIFRKQFVSVRNRDTGRFLFFDEIPEVNRHIISDLSETNAAAVIQDDIHYDIVENHLNPVTKQSYEWLKNVL